MLDEMGMDIFQDWILYYQEEPFSHLITRNQLANILASITNSSFENCGGVTKQTSISPDELKTRLSHIFKARNGRNK
jgi:hypothetical protein